jgi:hypothetical protein
MYASYFEKDQTVDGCSGEPGCGHRHDWEHIIVWLHDNAIQVVSFSVHGDWRGLYARDLRFDGTHVKAVYNKQGGGSHMFRPANASERPHRERHRRLGLPPAGGLEGLPQHRLPERVHLPPISVTPPSRSALSP